MFKLLVLAAIAAMVYGAMEVKADFENVMVRHHDRIERASNY